jgi:hypothetical protein
MINIIVAGGFVMIAGIAYRWFWTHPKRKEVTK